ncbi:MAG: glycosyl hydrolase family 38 [Ignavibacteriae bacterium]|nr:glycosyl hydrolase family 38 [Ignavibacteriota bacterium]
MKKKNFYFIQIFFSIIFLASALFAQIEKNEFIQGYNKVIQRGNFPYHSPHPDITKALLVRARKGEMVIEWQTEVVPKNYKNEFVSFVWYFGISQNSINHLFELSVNNKPYLKFKNNLGAKIGSWDEKGINNSLLTLKATTTDRYNDIMGIAILKININDIKIGEPVNIKVTGLDAESSDWYMTFQGKVNSDISIISTDLVAKGENENSIIYKLNIVHLDNPKNINIKTNTGFNLNSTVNTGFNTYTISVPSSFVNKNVDAEIKIGDKTITKTFEVNPVKEWVVNLVMHSHTDIGYTRSQTEILPEHLRFIDYALDFCDLTDNYPEYSKFRWTCESAWPVLKYLNSRPKSQIDRFRKRVKEGRIELTSMLFNISEIPDESLLASMLKPVKTITDSGFTISTAMQNDINGIGWCYADYLNNAGIKYLVMGEHGHRAKIPFNYPTVFWWESPAGNKILAYRADHYMTGNVIGAHTGNIDFVQSHLMQYLSNLNKAGYPYKEAHLQMSGYVTDNSPPSLMACNLAKEWNEKFEWPKLKISTASNFIKSIENQYGNSLPVQKAAWPDWWADGFGSAARETIESRRAQADLITNKGLLSIASLIGAEVPNNVIKELNEIEENLFFYAEHTFGADESVSNPTSENTIVQWLQKSSYVWDAVKRSKILKEKAMGYIQQFLPKAETSTIAVFNTLNWSRSGLTNIYIDHQIIPRNKKFKIVDFDGNEVFAQQQSSREDGTYWSIWAENIPPLGYKIYKIVIENELASIPNIEKNIEVFENQFYKIELDKKVGAVKSIFDKELKNELVDQKADWKLGQFIYEELSNRNQLERYTLDDQPVRTTLENVEFKGIKKGNIWNSIYLSGKNEKCSGDKEINLEIRLYNFEKKIDFYFSINKLAITNPEAVYIAFPFTLQNSKINFEAQGGIVEPGKDQIPGTSTDWNIIQNFASIKNDETQIIFSSNDIPLVHLGGLNIGEFNYVAKLENSHIYSWVLNNYWVTNFRASQDGELKWSYSLTSVNTKTNEKSYKFGYENKIPFASRVFPEGKTVNQNYSKSFLSLNDQNIILVSAMPFENTKKIILHLKEINGTTRNISLNNLVNKSAKSIYEVNVLGNKLSDNKDLQIKPFETKFVMVDL